MGNVCREISNGTQNAIASRRAAMATGTEFIGDGMRLEGCDNAAVNRRPVQCGVTPVKKSGRVAE
jgi:hypothetical protein